MEPRDVVFTFWGETWASAVQRQCFSPDRLVGTLLTHKAVKGLLVADPFRSGPTQFVRQLLGRRPIPFPARGTSSLISPMRFRRVDGLGRAALERTYADYDRRLKHRAHEMGLQTPAMITTNPLYAAYAPLDWTGPVTYYAWDDWAALPALQKWWPDLRDAYLQIRARGHRVCAISQPLLDTLNPIGSAALVPNGVDPAEWQPPWAETPWLNSLSPPRILYVGVIHTRLDIDAVREISRSFPGGSIIFVGPVSDAEIASQLRSIANVHLREPLPRKEIAGVIRNADVCIMPHRKNDLTKSMSPLKIYEYCAAGRPSAVTDLPPVHGISRLVKIVAEGASFAAVVAHALQDSPTSEEDRQAFLDRNSWARRHEEILQLALGSGGQQDGSVVVPLRKPY